MVNKRNNTYNRTNKIEPVHVKSSIYFDFNEENNKEGPKFKIGDTERILKYKIFLQKVILQIGQKKCL